MSRPTVNNKLREVLGALPVPTEYYAGVDGWSGEPPRNILAFARRTETAAMDGGVHMHPRFVFCWCVETGGCITVDGNMLALEPGQGLLLFPFQQHYFSSFRAGNILWMFVSFELGPQPSLESLRSQVFAIDDKSFPIMEQLVLAFRRATAGGNEESAHHGGAVAAWLMLLLGHLGERAERRKQRRVPASATREQDARIHRIVRFVYEHLDRSLTIDELAAAGSISPSHLRRLFREGMGISLGRFMLQARLNHALSLLHTTDLPVGRIADACGFGSVYSFSRAFRREKGLPPSAVQRRASR